MYYVVVCHYHGCDNCEGDGFHVVMVTDNLDDSEAVSHEHSYHNPAKRDLHYQHFFACNVVEREPGRVYEKPSYSVMGG